MALSPNRYASAQTLQERLDQGGTYAAAETALHNAVLGAAADVIDGEYGDTFARETATLVFTPDDSMVLRVPNLVSITTLKTDEDGDLTYERTWATADYLLWPTNAAARNATKPYTEVRVSLATGSGRWTFPVGLQNSVQIVGVWGYPRVPDDIQDVCILEAMRMLAQSNAPSGIVANQGGTATVVPDLHPYTRRVLMRYRKTGIGAAHGRG